MFVKATGGMAARVKRVCVLRASWIRADAFCRAGLPGPALPLLRLWAPTTQENIFNTPLALDGALPNCCIVACVHVRYLHKAAMGNFLRLQA